MRHTANMAFSFVERWVTEQLKRNGHDVTVNPRYSDRAWDLAVEGMRIEVKISARLTAYRKLVNGETAEYPVYRWNCSSIMDTTGEFPIILVAHTLVGTNYPFIVPASIIRGRGTRYPSITSHPLGYKGWLSPYLNKWSMIPGIIRHWQKEQGQLELFEFEGASDAI